MDRMTGWDQRKTEEKISHGGHGEDRSEKEFWNVTTKNAKNT
jgi:hypothetical protein